MNDRRKALEAIVSEPNRELDRECIAFSAYLIKRRPNEYVLAKYRHAHDSNGIIKLNANLLPLDRLLIGVAAIHPIGAKLVDAYTAIFHKKSSVRRKWILLLAIMESSAPSYEYFDSPDTGGHFWLAFLLLCKGGGFIVALILSVILFLPAHIISVLWTKL